MNKDIFIWSQLVWQTGHHAGSKSITVFSPYKKFTNGSFHHSRLKILWYIELCIRCSFTLCIDTFVSIAITFADVCLYGNLMWSNKNCHQKALTTVMNMSNSHKKWLIEFTIVMTQVHVIKTKGMIYNIHSSSWTLKYLEK